MAPLTPGIVSRLFGGQKRYQQDLEVAQQRHQEQLAAAQHQERERQRQVAAKQREHEATVRHVQAESQRHNDVLAAIELGMTARDKESKEVAAAYRSVVSQVALLCLRNLFQSDDKLGMIGFNDHVHAVNPATGVREFPCVISVQVERKTFLPDENLAAVIAEACLQKLGAIISQHPYEHEAIEPILDFDLSKFSFIEGLDAVATLDSRPNLLDMSHSNFEHLVRQIFVAQGAEGWTTTQSNDDGVDAVIAKRTALMGGLSTVQAKRYNPSNALGPSHVRELAGAMEEKKAGWGILITTSRFTSGCQQKAREHSRMELIDGDRLTWLIKEHLGKDVLIGPPSQKHD